MSQESFDTLFDTHYPENGQLVREETRAKLREKTYLALVDSVQTIEAVCQDLEHLTPTTPQELYDSLSAINHLPIWQVKGMPMLFDAYEELTETFKAAQDMFFAACDRRRGFLLRRNRPTGDELIAMRDAAFHTAIELKKWLTELDPRSSQK